MSRGHDAKQGPPTTGEQVAFFCILLVAALYIFGNIIMAYRAAVAYIKGG
jgi:hypothetical protein